LSMSEDDAETVRRIYDHLNRGDVDRVVSLCDEEIVVEMTERVFNPDVYRGHDGLRRFYEGVADAWESYHWTVEETRIAGDSVVAMLHCEGQSREGGPAVDWRVAWLWKFREGRPVFAHFYRARANALEAAGLRE